MSTTIKASIGVGDKLANGATCLAIRPTKDRPGEFVVLALWRDEFVTWLCLADGANTMTGHYFPGGEPTDLHEALADFDARP